MLMSATLIPANSYTLLQRTHLIPLSRSRLPHLLSREWFDFVLEHDIARISMVSGAVLSWGGFLDLLKIFQEQYSTERKIFF